MQIFSHPVEIWLGILLAVLIKLRGANFEILGFFGTAATVLISIISGVIFYVPIMDLLSLGPSWAIPTAILIALTAENLLKTVTEMTADKESLRKIAEGVLNRIFPSKKE